MSGIQLSGMEASDMVDVIHYMFESDFSNISSSEQMDAQSKMRSVLYKNLYGKDYKYGSPSSANSYDLYPEDAPEGDFDDIEPVDPMKMSQAVKPYVPPTDFNENLANPFGTILDAPLN